MLIFGAFDIHRSSLNVRAFCCLHSTKHHPHRAKILLHQPSKNNVADFGPQESLILCRVGSVLRNSLGDGLKESLLPSSIRPNSSYGMKESLCQTCDCLPHPAPRCCRPKCTTCRSASWAVEQLLPCFGEWSAKRCQHSTPYSSTTSALCGTNSYTCWLRYKQSAGACDLRWRGGWQRCPQVVCSVRQFQTPTTEILGGKGDKPVNK